MSKFAWVVRPYPHGKYRIDEFLEQGIVAMGYPFTGNLSDVSSRDEMKERLLAVYEYSPRSVGQRAGMLYNFVHEIEVGEYVLVPDGPVVFVGRVTSDYRHVPELSNDEEGYPHQRGVEWFFGGKAIPRDALSGRVYDSLKGRSTLFTTHHDDVAKVVAEDSELFTEGTTADLKDEYLERLQGGILRGVNSNRFEDAVRVLLERYFPSLERLSTTNSAEGDTDLMTTLPGGVVVRIQVKHFYPEHGEVRPWVVDQLAASMDEGDNGIVVTSGTVGEEARKKAESLKGKTVDFIDGNDFVDLLFENVEKFSQEDLRRFGLSSRIDFVSGTDFS